MALVQVAGLVEDRAKIEIETTALVADGETRHPAALLIDRR